MSDARDDTFRVLCDVVRRFNRSPNLSRREAIVEAAREMIEAYDEAAGEAVFAEIERVWARTRGEGTLNPGDTQPDETRCEIDGSLAVAGVCPTHGGDNCLVQVAALNPGDTET